MIKIIAIILIIISLIKLFASFKIDKTTVNDIEFLSAEQAYVFIKNTIVFESVLEFLCALFILTQC